MHKMLSWGNPYILSTKYVPGSMAIAGGKNKGKKLDVIQGLQSISFR